MSACEIETAYAIEMSLQALPENDRIGFLFGIIVAALIQQGMDRAAITTELIAGLELCYGPANALHIKRLKSGRR